MNWEELTTEELKSKLDIANSYLKESYELRKKRGGWIKWNADHEQQVEIAKQKIEAILRERSKESAIINTNGLIYSPQ